MLTVFQSTLSDAKEWFQARTAYEKVVYLSSAITGSLVLRHLYLRLRRKIYNYPPGPTGLPFIGYVLSHKPQTIQYWSQTIPTSRVTMFYLFGTPFVVLNSHDCYKQTMNTQTYRQPLMRFKNPNHVPAFLNMNHNGWKQRRKLNHGCFTTLINSNYIDKSMPQLMHKSLFQTLDNAASLDTPYFCGDDLRWMSFAFLFSVFFGTNIRCPRKDDALYQKFMKLNNLGFSNVKLSVLLTAIPNKTLRDYVWSVLDPQKPWGEMIDIMTNWYKQTDYTAQEEQTYFKRMTTHFKNGEISINEACADATSLCCAALHVTTASLQIALYC
eukprot:960165_1